MRNSLWLSQSSFDREIQSPSCFPTHIINVVVNSILSHAHSSSKVKKRVKVKVVVFLLLLLVSNIIYFIHKIYIVNIGIFNSNNNIIIILSILIGYQIKLINKL